jgi:hypothetical protein
MTSADKLSGLREQLLADEVPGLLPCWNTLMIALLDELEKARVERDEANALLREAAGGIFSDEGLRARISKHLEGTQ